MNLHNRGGGGILVVDDHPPMLQAIVELLAFEFPRTRLRSATGALDAIDACIAAMPQVVVLDIMLPGMNGLDTLVRIRALDARVQVVMHSTFDDAEFRERAAGAGAAAFVSKSQPTRLLPEVGRLLALPDA